MSTKKKLLLGSHMSIAGGLHNALTEGESIGCTAIQFFTKSNRQWHTKDLLQEDVDLFIATKAKSPIESVVAHASYLINLGSPDPLIHKKSVIAAAKELSVCQALDIPFLVVHPGSYTSSTPQEGCQAIADGINQIIKITPGKSMILLETMAGQGTVLGSTFSELALIISLIKEKNRVGVCLDTCHVFAAGYELSTPQSYKKLWDDFDTIIGRSYLKVIHLNDSKKECNSRVDRHENIGKGAIGIEGFTLFMNDETLFNIPKILETPKTTLAQDSQNMNVLKDLLNKKTRELLTV